MTPSSARIQMGRGGEALFIILVVVAFVITFSAPLDSATPFRISILFVAGMGYTLLGLLGDPYVERSGSRLVLIAFLGLRLLLGALVVFLSEARGALILLPLAADAIERLSRPWAIVLCILTVAAVFGPTALVLVMARGSDGTQLYPWLSPPFMDIMVPIVLQYLMAFVFVILYTLAGVRERKARNETDRLAAELQAANRRLREYAAQAEELATAHERNRLAREIHDGLGHYLTGIHMQIQAGRAVLDIDHDAALDALDKAQTLAQEGLTEVRRSVAALRATPLDAQSLPQAIEALVAECRTAGIETPFAVLGERVELAPQAEMTLYRVAQEALTNVRRHAQATHAEVTLDYRAPEQVKLTVRDDGVGADAPGGGFGLVGVRERVHLLGGQVEIETSPGAGFCLRVQVPAA